jgi:hypothetical protein
MIATVMKTSAVSMARIRRFSRPTSCSTSTRSTITCVKTGRSMASPLATTARPMARLITDLNGRTNGQSQAALGASTGARANASV